MLSTICKLVSQTVADQLVEFYTTTLLTENLLTEEIFLANAQGVRDQFTNTTRNSFLTSLNAIRAIVQGNGIVNRLGTNFKLGADHNNTHIQASSPISYSSYQCSCALSSYCTMITSISSAYRGDLSYNSIEFPHSKVILANLTFLVTGINVGCFVLDAVLQSNLSCLYNTSCLSQLNTYLTDSLYPYNATALLNSSPSYSPQTIGELADNLMVDNWLFTPSYEAYFTACNPPSCTYTYTHQFDIIYVITTTVGFIGGIVTILMLLTVPLVTFIRRRIFTQGRLSPSLIDDDHTTAG
ncbi:unnamed protein product [Didymodactylos carnosus]|uniref:Uncharacterized protein n=1 Tax=Didymodactylos carnosus TaxID=1234261 RepID=A0A8S2FQ93_9BILA|nr:unnamed protein product [Didymodactylos carnosus]CAF4316693.1 unnamed protein product [Didymodactylos carnosus]